MATNSTCVSHEVLARAVSEGLVQYIEGAKKIGKILKKFVHPIKMVRWGSPPIRMVPPAIVFLLGLGEVGGTVSRYSNRTETLL